MTLRKHIPEITTDHHTQKEIHNGCNVPLSQAGI